jgi:hypothetical protein
VALLMMVARSVWKSASVMHAMSVVVRAAIARPMGPTRWSANGAFAP